MDKLNAMLAREGRTALATASFGFLPDRVRLDLAGWANEDIFSHSVKIGLKAGPFRAGLVSGQVMRQLGHIRAAGLRVGRRRGFSRNSAENGAR